MKRAYIGVIGLIILAIVTSPAWISPIAQHYPGCIKTCDTYEEAANALPKSDVLIPDFTNSSYLLDEYTISMSGANYFAKPKRLESISLYRLYGDTQVRFSVEPDRNGYYGSQIKETGELFFVGDGWVDVLLGDSVYHITSYIAKNDFNDSEMQIAEMAAERWREELAQEMLDLMRSE